MQLRYCNVFIYLYNLAWSTLFDASFFLMINVIVCDILMSLPVDKIINNVNNIFIRWCKYVTSQREHEFIPYVCLYVTNSSHKNEPKFEFQTLIYELITGPEIHTLNGTVSILLLKKIIMSAYTVGRKSIC